MVSPQPTPSFCPARWFNAAIAGDVNELEAGLMSGFDINTQEPQRHETALMLAAREGNPAVLWLLQMGADPNISNIHGNTALMIAAFRNHVTAAQDLIDHGANVRAQNAIASPVLMMASASLAITQMLLATSAIEDINAQDLHGFTPLLQAAYSSSGHTPDPRLADRCGVIELLVAYGANPNAKTNMEQSALMLAASWGAGPVVKTLLTLGADPLWVNSLGQRACDFWPVSADPDVRALLTHQENICVLSRSCLSKPPSPHRRHR